MKNTLKMQGDTSTNNCIIVDIQGLTAPSHIIIFYISLIMKKYIQNEKKKNILKAVVDLFFRVKLYYSIKCLLEKTEK